MGECTHVHLCAGTGTDWKDVHPNVKGTVSGDGIMVDFFPPPIVNVIFNRKKKKRKKIVGNSLVAQWLGLCVSTGGATGWIPGQGAKILQTSWKV